MTQTGKDLFETLREILPGSEMAQIITDAGVVAGDAQATEARCPWQPTEDRRGQAARWLWLATFAEWRAASAAQAATCRAMLGAS